ncbi:L,D-transpeptidase [Mesorhizobium sp. BAC0120]|uniref:L,D-transpeptidase n=1 Tax=Mesorhizobium sp. BAC0120 TaxID=3090670 RepID=UPI00298D0294|nr:L,D-transpeptidase [Mesorhizobium sp. BAC0120]MDW6024061.1 L,D-transpeptidase [Mesorhizobium sp. BAC0120]
MRLPLFLGLAAAVAAPVLPAEASDRYAERPPVIVSPDLAAPWVMQLRRNPVSGWQARTRQIPDQTYGSGTRTSGWQTRTKQLPPQTYPRVRWQPQPDAVETAAVPPQPQMYTKQEMQRKLDPKFLPREVAYDGQEKPGTIIIDSGEKFLYLVLNGGKARRYGVGVGKEGFGWSGTEKITRKAQWPEWRPPAEMIARERAKGRMLPVMMAGGPENPLGARALYLGSTLYRIHGTNAPWTIGTNVSSGCIRMRNEDVVDLFERVDIGTKVVVM